MQRTGTTWLLASVLTAGLLMTFAVPASAAPTATASISSSAGAPDQWAYGGQQWVNASTQLSNGVYNSSAFFGWQVVFTATNTTNSTIELTAQRTLVASYNAQYCAPNCDQPRIQGTLNISGIEHDLAYANLTTNGSVTERGLSASAVGILNASSSSQANLTEKLVLLGTLNGMSRSGSSVLFASGHSHAFVNFGSMGLGLVPWNVTPGASWTSAAPFIAGGTWSLSYLYNRSLAGGPSINGTGNPNGTVNTTGTVRLMGTDLGNVTLKNGLTVPRIQLAVLGPFDLLDGVFFLPHQFDPFGSGARAWAGASLGTAAAATSEVDFALTSDHRSVRIAAAMTAYGSTDSSLAGGSQSITDTSSSPSSAGTTSVPIQAQPETVPQAQKSSQCYTGGCFVASPPGPLAPGASTPSSVAQSGLGSFVPVLVIGLVAVVIVGTVGVIEWRVLARRRAARGRSPNEWVASGAPGQTVPGQLPASPSSIQGPSSVEHTQGPPRSL
jgi:hypothetical protein